MHFHMWFMHPKHFTHSQACTLSYLATVNFTLVPNHRIWAGMLLLGSNHRSCLCMGKAELKIDNPNNSWPVITVDTKNRNKILTWELAYIHTYVHTYIRTYMHTHTYIHTYVRTYIHTYIHMYTHTHTHTHTHTRTQTPPSRRLCRRLRMRSCL